MIFSESLHGMVFSWDMEGVDSSTLNAVEKKEMNEHTMQKARVRTELYYHLHIKFKL
jgi:hypothetical protein